MVVETFPIYYDLRWHREAHSAFAGLARYASNHHEHYVINLAERCCRNPSPREPPTAPMKLLSPANHHLRLHPDHQSCLCKSRRRHQDRRHRRNRAAKRLNIHPSGLEDRTRDGVADEEADAGGEEKHANTGADDTHVGAESCYHRWGEGDEGAGEESGVIESSAGLLANHHD